MSSIHNCEDYVAVGRLNRLFLFGLSVIIMSLVGGLVVRRNNSLDDKVYVLQTRVNYLERYATDCKSEIAELTSAVTYLSGSAAVGSGS